MYYLFIFAFYSIIGWIFETLIALIANIDFNSGIMHGPWTPVYGLSAIIMIIIWRKWLYNIKNKKILKSFIFFLATMFVLSILELVAGLLIQLLMGTTYWDYSKVFPLHIGKFISVEVGILWGILSLLTIWFINPKIEKLIVKIPKVIIYIFYGIFLLDLIITILTKFV